MSEYTQGGWNRNIPPASKYNTIYAGRNTHICRLEVRGLPESEIEANCNLIVAAPDLLAECKKELEWLKHIKPQITAPESVMLGFEQAIKYLSVAINKAEGK